MVNLIPELELVIGNSRLSRTCQHRMPELLSSGIRRFLGVFARAEHPLALFLDDLQWLDTATLELLDVWSLNLRSITSC